MPFRPDPVYYFQLADILEVSLDHLLRGTEGQELLSFEIKNKKLKELCKKVDELKPADQDVVCHFLDMAVTQDKLKQLMVSP
ncbi:hypothetical protein [Teredinibacter haidensis]|uniref:hypothetical protein n=1 Tax=Teredinibacter haidensis TaxID=2731755 RepID=UPI000948AB35|nr:hypothetical protein [Teredinibacter haidensis]